MTDGPAGAPGPAGAGAPTGSQARRRLEIASNWITALTAVAALVLSAVTYGQVNSAPSLRIDLARAMLVAGAGQSPTVDTIWLQPLFTVSNTSNQMVIIRTLELDARRIAPARGVEAAFYFAEFSSLELEPGFEPGTTFGGFPTPFPVSREAPQALMLRFDAVDPARLALGVWDVDLRVVLADDSEIVSTFCIDVGERLSAEIKNFSLTLRNDVPGAQPSGCYAYGSP